MISIQGLDFSWPDGDFQLRVPTLEIAGQTAVAVTGPSGCGKTTLLSVITGILPASSGSVCVGGVELSGMPDSQRRAFRLRQTGLVFQSFELIEYLSVLDNVLLPARISHAVTLTAELRQRARELLNQAGLQQYAARSITQLSQGERQRVAVCRALLTRPSLILADEPTGNLDPDNTLRILTILLDQVRTQGATLLMVSHDHSLLPHFDSTVDLASLSAAESVAAGGDGAA